MASEGQKDLLAAIESRAFEPVYLFTGEDEFRKHEALQRLLTAAVDPATREFNLETRRAADITAESLGSILETPPMLAERRVVVVRDAGALKKDAKEVVERYLMRPAPDVVLVLIQAAGEKIEPKFQSARCVDFESLSGPRLTRWIIQRAATGHGASISTEAAELLVSAVGNDLLQLNIELEKLAAFSTGGVIDEAAIAAVVGIRREESLSALLDAVAERNAAAALRVLPGILEQPKSSAVFIVIVLGVQVLGTAFAKARLDRRVPPGRLVSELMAMMKEGSAYPGRSWSEACSAWIRTADLWSEADLAYATKALHAADRALKDAGRASEEGILQTAILSLCRPPARRAA